MRIYATTEDLTAWISPVAVPTNAAGLLRSASGLIRSETKTAVYATGTDGYPTDTALIAAFMEATCAQAKFWTDHKIDPSLGAAGVAPLAASKSIGGASIQYSTYVSTAEARANAAGVLGPDAWYILADAGLLGNPVVLL